MKKPEELLKLADQVERGEATEYDIWQALPCYEHDDLCNPVLESLDCAKKLHDAMLPEWWGKVEIGNCQLPFEVGIERWGGTIENSKDNKRIQGKAANPAAAWVAAILRAKAQES